MCKPMKNTIHENSNDTKTPQMTILQEQQLDGNKKQVYVSWSVHETFVLNHILMIFIIV